MEERTPFFSTSESTIAYALRKNCARKAGSASIANRIKRLAPLEMSIPGREGAFTKYLARNTGVSDFSPYMGPASITAVRGYPIAIGTAPQVSYVNAQGNMVGIGFSFTIGQDKFITNTEAGLSRDLHKDARALTPDLA